MPRVIGVDPGTLSFDLCGLEDGVVFLDQTITSSNVAANPHVLVEALRAAGPLDLVIGPSGYGLPWVRAEEFGDQEHFLFVLSDQREQEHAAPVGGMHEIVRALRETGLPVLFMPGVIHLPTVPAYRKANKIDMGTADKLCCLALGIVDQSRYHQIPYQETSFIYVEVGGAFTSVMAVEAGQVIDGFGGSSGAPGFRALGTMDGELAYLLGCFPKEVLFSGGVASITGQPDIDAAEAVRLIERNPAVKAGWEALFEGVTKYVAAELAVVPKPREILLSGRLSRIPVIRDELRHRLSRFAPVRQIQGIAQIAKEAAQGAALIADGLMNGQFASLVEVMRLHEASGTVLDYLHVKGADELRRKYLNRKPT
jgi:predicted butyrate kinase (DUF1464 family)